MKKRAKLFSLAMLILLLICLCSCEISIPDIFSKPDEKESSAPSQSTDSAEESESGTEQGTENHSYPALTLSNQNTSLGTVTGKGSYAPGSSVTVTAAPSVLGYTLDGWYANGERVSDTPSYTFTMPNESFSLEARWKPVEEISDFTFTSTATTCTVTGVANEAATALTVPAFVTELGAGAFRNCTAVQTIRLPSSITTLPDEAFRGCAALTSLECDGGITAIGKDVFAGCNRSILTEYENGLYFGGESPYTWLVAPKDANITACTIHEDTKYIAPHAFANCASLQEIAIPEGIEALSKHAFDGCSSLTAISLPETLCLIDVSALNHCPSLTNIRYAGSTIQWDAIHIETGNNRLDALAIHCKNGDATYEIRGYGRAHLYRNEAYVYDLLEEAMLSDTLPETIAIDPSRLVTPSQCKTAFEFFLLDYPECFWLKQSFSYVPIQSGSNIVSQIKPMYLMTGSELAQAKERLNQVVEEILRDMPVEGFFEQTHYLHDAVAKRVSYVARKNWDQTAYSALVNGEAVCAGYAAAYQLLLQTAGYKAWSINGYSRNQDHRWNVIWLDHATCVYTDVTWDDHSDSQILHGYFNQSLEDFSKTHVATDPSLLPSCHHEGQGYFDHPTQQYQVINSDDPFEKLKNLLTKQEDGSYVCRLYYTGENFMNWLVEHQDAIAEQYGFNGISVSMDGQEPGCRTGEILLTLKGT